MIDLIINLAATAIAYLFGLGTTWAYRKVKTRGQRRFWAPFLGGKERLAIVLTDKLGLHARSPRKISLTDVRAYSDVRSILSSLGREVEIKEGSSADIQELSKHSFVSLGGPLANGITEHVLARLGNRLLVTFNKDAKRFEHAGAIYEAKLDVNELVAQDYGLIVRLNKLDAANSQSKPVLVAFGLHGHGTYQTVQSIISDKDFTAQLRPLLKDDLYALISFEFENHICKRSTVITVGRIR